MRRGLRGSPRLWRSGKHQSLTFVGPASFNADSNRSHSDDDLAHFAHQRRTMDAVADAWKKADLLIKAQDHDAERLKATIR